jgi:outer membrane protein assembly factor BamB
VISRGGLFSGTAGGRLLAMDLATETSAGKAMSRHPKGDRARAHRRRHVAAVSRRAGLRGGVQGRVACFEILRGQLALDARRVEPDQARRRRSLSVSDDAGAVHALDKVTGASAWKQDKLAQRRIGGPQLAGDLLAVVDPEGYVHLIDRNDGSMVGRAPTDGTPATDTAAASRANAVWQSERHALRGHGALSHRRAANSRMVLPFGSVAAPPSPPCSLPSSSSGGRTSASRRCSTGDAHAFRVGRRFCRD